MVENIVRRPDGKFILCRGPGRNRSHWEKLVAFRASGSAVRVLERFKTNDKRWGYSQTLEKSLALLELFQSLSLYADVEAFGDEPKEWLRKARELLR